jgi:hypothetical protein
MPKSPVIDLPENVLDRRTEFAAIFCAELETGGVALPDYMPCDQALSPLAPLPKKGLPAAHTHPSPTPVVAALVPGIGYACVAKWLHPDDGARDRIRSRGSDLIRFTVDAFSGSKNNAVQVRDAILALPPSTPPLVLIGYSKGTPDVLEAIVRFPELLPRVVAVVSISGAVGGSPIADDHSERTVELLRHFPGAQCDGGDGLAIDSLKPSVRRAWLESHALPPELRYYSVVTLPAADRISRVMKPTWRKLAKLDPLNDGQVLYRDQIIPGSALLAFLNADHWASVMPINRSHPVESRLFVDANGYPREVLLDAILMFVQQDLASPPAQSLAAVPQP